MTPVHPNLGRCFDAARAPSKVAIIDTANWDHPRAWTYAELDAECDAVARGLLAQGLKRGDRVGILSLNRFELLAAYFGTMRAGLVSVPISFKLPRETIDHIVQDADLRAVFHDRERAGLCPAGLPSFDFDDPTGVEPRQLEGTGTGHPESGPRPGRVGPRHRRQRSGPGRVAGALERGLQCR